MKIAKVDLIGRPLSGVPFCSQSNHAAEGGGQNSGPGLGIDFKTLQSEKTLLRVFLVSRDEAGGLRKLPVPLHYVYAFAAVAIIGAFTVAGLAWVILAHADQDRALQPAAQRSQRPAEGLRAPGEGRSRKRTSRRH